MPLLLPYFPDLQFRILIPRSFYETLQLTDNPLKELQIILGRITLTCNLEYATGCKVWLVVLPRFELGLIEPKSIVLPLQHKTMWVVLRPPYVKD